MYRRFRDDLQVQKRRGCSRCGMRDSFMTGVRTRSRGGSPSVVWLCLCPDPIADRPGCVPHRSESSKHDARTHPVRRFLRRTTSASLLPAGTWMARANRPCRGAAAMMVRAPRKILSGVCPLAKNSHGPLPVGAVLAWFPARPTPGASRNGGHLRRQPGSSPAGHCPAPHADPIRRSRGGHFPSGPWTVRPASRAAEPGTGSTSPGTLIPVQPKRNGSSIGRVQGAGMRSAGFSSLLPLGRRCPEGR